MYGWSLRIASCWKMPGVRSVLVVSAAMDVGIGKTALPEHLSAIGKLSFSLPKRLEHPDRSRQSNRDRGVWRAE